LPSVYPHFAGMRSSLALVYAELGEKREAGRIIGQLARWGFDRIARDRLWLQAMAELAETLWLLDDREHAPALYELLEPFAGRTIVALFCTLTWGSAARSLGLLAALCGRSEVAERHFLAAIERNRAAGAWPWVAHSQYACARLLAERPGSVRNTGPPAPGGPAERAAALLRDAQLTAAELGMTALEQRCRALDAELARRFPVRHDSMTPSLHDPIGAEHVFRREGQYWTLSYDGEIIRVRHVRGLTYIAELLRHPHRDLPALVLATADVGVIPAPESRAAGRILDDESRAAYKRRLDELRNDLAEAEERGAGEHAAVLRQEIDALARDLRRAIGRGGRDRRSGSTAERARLNVSRAIATAIKSISTQHRGLGAYLQRTIRTGTSCTYAPGLEALVDWQF
jgi:hypothetical protein